MRSFSTEDNPPSYSQVIYSNQVDEWSVSENQYDVLFEQTSDLDNYETETISDTDLKNEMLLQKQLDQNYPVKYVIWHCVVMAVLNVTLISLQIVAIRNNAAISYIGSAIWAGLYNLITVVMAVFTSNYLFVSNLRT